MGGIVVENLMPMKAMLHQPGGNLVEGKD